MWNARWSDNIRQIKNPGDASLPSPVGYLFLLGTFNVKQLCALLREHFFRDDLALGYFQPQKRRQGRKTPTKP
jgi:hypothetical protein